MYSFFLLILKSTEASISFSEGRIASTEGFLTDLKAVAIFCNSSNLSAFSQNWLSYSKLPVSSVRAAYFVGWSVILQNRKCSISSIALLLSNEEEIFYN